MDDSGDIGPARASKHAQRGGAAREPAWAITRKSSVRVRPSPYASGTLNPERKGEWAFPRKQKLEYHVVDERHACVVCGKPIKKRLVHQKRTPPRYCFAHWMELKKKGSVGPRAAPPRPS